MAATPALANPHVILTELGGLKSPSVVSIPRTNVAESADVIKKIAITIIVIIDITKPNGNCSSIPKVIVSISRSEERRVGKECRYRWARSEIIKKVQITSRLRE